MKFTRRTMLKALAGLFAAPALAKVPPPQHAPVVIAIDQAAKGSFSAISFVGTSLPSAPLAGDVFYDVNRCVTRIYDGLKWVDISTDVQREHSMHSGRCGYCGTFLTSKDNCPNCGAPA